MIEARIQPARNAIYTEYPQYSRISLNAKPMAMSAAETMRLARKTMALILPQKQASRKTLETPATRAFSRDFS